MAATRSRKEERIYKRYLSSKDAKTCPFCEIRKGDNQLVRQYRYFRVIKNIYPYSLWDGLRVVDHLMIIPNKHVATFSDMTPAQKVEYVDIVEAYEGQGYNMYARAPESSIKSIVHQHTHLIQTTGLPKRFVLLVRKPYFRLTK